MKDYNLNYRDIQFDKKKKKSSLFAMALLNLIESDGGFQINGRFVRLYEINY